MDRKAPWPSLSMVSMLEEIDFADAEKYTRLRGGGHGTVYYETRDPSVVQKLVGNKETCKRLGSVEYRNHKRAYVIISSSPDEFRYGWVPKPLTFRYLTRIQDGAGFFRTNMGSATDCVYKMERVFPLSVPVMKSFVNDYQIMKFKENRRDAPYLFLGTEEENIISDRQRFLSVTLTDLKGTRSFRDFHKKILWTENDSSVVHNMATEMIRMLLSTSKQNLVLQDVEFLLGSPNK
eukprot:1700184-Prymnesium_polylepis.1